MRVDVLERVEGLEADGGGHDDEVCRGLEDRLLETRHGKCLYELACLGTQPGRAVEQREKARRVADAARAELPGCIVGTARVGEHAEHLRSARHENARVPAAALVDGALCRRELRVRGKVAHLEGALHVGVLAPEADVGDVGGLFCLLGADETDAVAQSHLVGAVEQAFQALVGVDTLVCPEHGHHRVGVFAAGARARERNAERAATLHGKRHDVAGALLEARPRRDFVRDELAQRAGRHDANGICREFGDAAHRCGEQAFGRIGRQRREAGRRLLARDGPQSLAVVIGEDNYMKMRKYSHAEPFLLDVLGCTAFGKCAALLTLPL